MIKITKDLKQAILDVVAGRSFGNVAVHIPASVTTSDEIAAVLADVDTQKTTVDNTAKQLREIELKAKEADVTSAEETLKDAKKALADVNQQIVAADDESLTLKQLAVILKNQARTCLRLEIHARQEEEDRALLEEIAAGDEQPLDLTATTVTPAPKPAKEKFWERIVKAAKSN
ncbi:hypothetical protein HYV31_00200 [candidate division WWE3 bacterium]|nr:hypothetical protein [candidate division WWE3 bacterium]